MISSSEINANVVSLIRSRRTVHYFQDKKVPQAMVSSAIEAARWAPNHHRTEPWHFYLLDEIQINSICAFNADIVRNSKGEKAAEVKLKRWRAMPGWLVVTSKKNSDPIREREDYAACCCAAQNLMLILWEQGIGVKWTTGDITRERDFFEMIGADANEELVVGLFWYGYPEMIPEQHRKPIEQSLSYPQDRR